jgi:3-phenylpropionate/trans-cinnamate dioxygenase ferredoxin reductase subunit
MTTKTTVIVGAGLAGAKAAEALRTNGYDGAIRLVGAEPHAPYERPELSKALLLGKKQPDDLLVHTPDWYDDNGVDLLVDTVVADLDRGSRTVVAADGSRIKYDQLLLATGSAPRHLAVQGAEEAHYLRTVGDAEKLAGALGSGVRLVVVGGGWIGLETAAAARQRGAQVDVVEPQSAPLHSSLGPEIGGHFARLHREHGVRLHLGRGVTEVSAHHVVTTTGERLEADVVLLGVGARPRTRLAEEAGLRVENGIVVDELLRTSDPHVYAAGDVANAFHPGLGRHIRVEHWANALNQGLAAGATLAGRATSYDRVPYFYTDQYDTGMEYSGHMAPGEYDRLVVRGNPESGKFLAFWLREGRLLAGMSVNTWDVTATIQALVRAGWAGATVDPDQLADPDTALDTVGVA